MQVICSYRCRPWSLPVPIVLTECRQTWAPIVRRLVLDSLYVFGRSSRCIRSLQQDVSAYENCTMDSSSFWLALSIWWRAKTTLVGFRNCLSNVLRASANVAELLRRVKWSEPKNVRRKTNLSASSVLPLTREPSSKHFFHHFHFSGEGFEGKSGGVNFMGDRRENTAYRQLLRGT